PRWRAIEEEFPGLSAESPGQRGSLARHFLLPTEQALATLGTIALVAGCLMILNTFLMHLHERRRQLALLRAVGATRRQVVGLVLRQALLLGGAGALVGLPLGLAGAFGLLRFNQTYLDVPLSGLYLSTTELILAALLGPVVTVAVAV